MMPTYEVFSLMLAMFFFDTVLVFVQPPCFSSVFNFILVACRSLGQSRAAVVCGCVFFRKIAIFRLLKKKKKR